MGTWEGRRGAADKGLVRWGAVGVWGNDGAAVGTWGGGKGTSR